jgi:hypothetical protein
MNQIFSWLLVLTLTATFAGCSDGDDDTAGTGGSAGSNAGTGGTGTGGTGAGGQGGSTGGTGGSGGAAGSGASGGSAGSGAEGGMPDSAGGTSGGSAGTGGGEISERCTQYCDLFKEVCIDTGIQVIPDGQECGAFCESFTDDQYQCRWVHTQLVVPEDNPNHCNHAIGIQQCIDG